MAGPAGIFFPGRKDVVKMDLLKNVTDSVTKAVNFVVDQNRRAALINRLKIVIGNEKEVKARAYIELGKYYYKTMRDEENEETESLCRRVDNSDRRLKKAYAKLDELVRPTGAPEEDEEEEISGGSESRTREEQAPGDKSFCEELFGERAEEVPAPVEAARGAGDGEAADEEFPLE